MKNTVTEIVPRQGFRLIDIREIFFYRDLLFYLVMRDIKSLYKQTVLGFSWAIIRPFFSMVVFSIVFGGLAKMPSDGVPYPIFTYAALIPWTYFSTVFTTSSASLIQNKSILSKVYFPRIFIPIAPSFSKLVDFIISFSILIVMMVRYEMYPDYKIIFLPMLIIIMVLFSTGCGMLLSALAIQYRDIPHGIQFLTQLLMYGAPVVWPISLLNEKYGETVAIIYSFYPMAGVIEGFRSSLLGTTDMPWFLIASGFFSSFVIFLFGMFYFNKKQQIFADVA